MAINFESSRNTGQREAALVDVRGSLRRLFNRVGRDAYALAYALSNDAERAERAVVGAFVAVSHATLELDPALDRRAVLAHVIAAYPRDSATAGRRLVLVLAESAGCSLGEIAEITGVDHRQVARDFVTALRDRQRTSN